MKPIIFAAIVLGSISVPCFAAAAEPVGFPYNLPDKKPNRPLSVAMERLYDDYLAPTPEANELYSTFKFTPLEGLDYHNGDAWLDFNGIETWKSIDKVYETVARDDALKNPTKPTMRS